MLGALALATLVLLYLTRGYSAVSSSISTNEITDKSSQYNYYCDAGLCKTGVTHIGCLNKGHFGPKCTKDARVIPLDDYQRRLILHMHNHHRNTIASGRTPNFPQAARMGALQWDDELAHLALMNAMSCEIEHDKVRQLCYRWLHGNYIKRLQCRNTRAYPFSGQNLALGWLLDDHTIDWAIRNFTSEWYIEYSDANPNIIDSFYRSSGPAIGHFTMLVNDKQSKGAKHLSQLRDIINLNWFWFYLLNASRLWPCKVNTKIEQLQLQSPRLCLQLLVDECFHPARVQEGKGRLAVHHRPSLLLRWPLQRCRADQRKFLLKSTKRKMLSHHTIH